MNGVLSGIVYYNDIPVGTACCRIEKGVGDEPSKLYIMTMVRLPPLFLHAPTYL